MPPAPSQPLATYRLQLSPGFRLADARALVPYLARLGITHLYLSPILRARPGSNHGYDAVDPRVINPELGDETDLSSLVTDLRQYGLGLILDIVPNHMATSFENPYWRDVLTYGRASPFAGWFDIDWRMPDPDLWGRVLVPVLGARFLHVLRQGQISLAWSDGRFLARYFDHVFPLDPATVPSVCVPGLPRLRALLGENRSTLFRIAAILSNLEKLPRLRSRQRRQVHIDRERAEELLAQLAQQIVQSPRIQEWAEETAVRFGQGPEGRLRLHRLLASQPYRLVYWRRAARMLNYRRFFDINELISVRQEDPQVFAQTHATILRWVEQGLVDGLRIDHIDGLRNPLVYLNWLSSALAERGRSQPDFTLFVEKILAAGEPLPPAWSVSGTTGYDFLNQVELALVSWSGFSRIEEEYRHMLRRPVRFGQLAAWGKRRVLRNELSAPVGRLAQHLLRLVYPDGRPPVSALSSPQAPDYRDLVSAIVEVMVALPVYRTYIDAVQGAFGETDALYLRQALEEARQSGRATPESIDLLGSVLLPLQEDAPASGAAQGRIHFVERFQQVSGPAAAKGIEDTALYAYAPLASLNEVGGEPRAPAETPTAVLHRANAARAAAWPSAMLAVTTHDTKRSADVRARLDVLSEMPGPWWRLVRRWRRLNRPLRSVVRGRLVPGAATEYLFYQTVAGIWPAPEPGRHDQLPEEQELVSLAERIAAYMLKAVREAKTWTSWTRGDQPYEDAVLSFVRNALHPAAGAEPGFLSGMQALVARIARPGFWNSLSRTLIQFTAPGTPDLYQGDELWNFALVDPDNRRPVDFQKRLRLLDDVILASEDGQPLREFLRQCMAHPEDGRIKLHLVHRLLRARRDQPALFGASSYQPLEFEGPLASHLFGFVRTSGNEAALVLAARLSTQLVPHLERPPTGPSVWPEENGVRLPGTLKRHAWTCALSGERFSPISGGRRPVLPVSCLLAHLPVTLLIGKA